MPKSILEGLNETLAITRLGLPPKLRKSLGSTSIIESMNGFVRQVIRNVKPRRFACMALRWTASGMFEARKGFRRVIAYRKLPILEQAFDRYRGKSPIDAMEDAALRLIPATVPGKFNTDRDNPSPRFTAPGSRGPLPLEETIKVWSIAGSFRLRNAALLSILVD